MNRYMNRTSQPLFTVSRATGRLSVALAGLLGLSAVCPSVAMAEFTRQDIALTAAEESLLIATRESTAMHPPATKVASTAELGEDQNPLEPISQISERSPELADDAPRRNTPSDDSLSDDALSDDASGFGEELAKAAGKKQPTSGSAADDLGTASKNGLVAEPAKFNDIQPGSSTKQDVLDAWDEPTRSAKTDHGEVLSYTTEPFQLVEVLIIDEKVTAIKIALAEGLTSKRLAKQLKLDKINSVVVTDEDGLALGEVYPERGVLFLYGAQSAAAIVPADSKPTVTHVVLQPLDANAFALRAEQRLHGPYEENIHDLSTALSLNPDLAHAQWLLAEIYLATGRADQAESAASAACELEPDNGAYQLRRAKALRQLGRYDEATREVRAVVDQEDVAPIVQAAAMHEMASLATLGDGGVASKAISFDVEAIRLADTVASSENVKERRAAKQLLVETHLAVARDIASHAFNNKLESVSQWIGRASGLAEDFIATDGGSLELRLLVAKQALAALASFKPSKDPADFISEAKQAAELLAEQSDDNLWRRRIQWELGQSYYYALQIEHARMQPDSALRYGQLAIENLAEGAEARQAVHESEQLVGALYFQIGAVHAVHKNDHKTAVEWYDKAIPLLTAPRPFSELLVPQREGEQLVSMGVSYWQTGDKDRGLELTRSGLELIQQAVDARILGDSALVVPYGNMASMYQQLGEPGDAAKYAELAKSAVKQTSATAPVNTLPARPQAAISPSPSVSQAPRPGRTSQNQPSGEPVRRSSQRQGQTLLN